MLIQYRVIVYRQQPPTVFSSTRTRDTGSRYMDSTGKVQGVHKKQSQLLLSIASSNRN